MVCEGYEGGVLIVFIVFFLRMWDFLVAYGGKDEVKNVECVVRVLEGSDVVEVCVDGMWVWWKLMFVNGEMLDFVMDDGVTAYRSAMVEELDKRFVFVSLFVKDVMIEVFLVYFKMVGNVWLICLC